MDCRRTGWPTGLTSRRPRPTSSSSDTWRAFRRSSGSSRETIEQGTEHGYVSTLLGRRRQVPELRARRWELRKQGERFAVNMVIQGTAADIMKLAMVDCDRALAESGLRSRLVLQIHDELLFEGPAEEAETVRALAVEQMAGAFEMDPPLAVEAGIGADWLAAK